MILTITLLTILSFELYLVIMNTKLKEKNKMQQNTIDYYQDILMRTLNQEKLSFEKTHEIVDNYNIICRKINKKIKQLQSKPKNKYQHKTKGGRTWKLM